MAIPKALADFYARWLPLIGWILLIVLVICSAVFLAFRMFNSLQAESAGNVISLVVAIIFLVSALLLILSFLWIFKGIDADSNTLSNMVIYCYAFIVFSMSASVVPFFIFPHVPDLVELFETSPIGIVKGCSIAPPNAKEDYVPAELRCDRQTDQWVVNIGGFVKQLNTGEQSGPYTLRRIQGGLVVPLYVIVLSLMGATVSMTRRVPEFQRRLSPGDPEYVTYGHAREALVFQIMQVASAPLIAMTIYYLVDPSARVSTIVVAFASGFSSETILLLIRAVLEKIQPEVTKPQNRTHVRLSPVRLDFGDVPVNGTAKKTIAVTNSTGLDLQVIGIECTGEYSISTEYSKKVAAGSSIPIEVTFNPQSVGSKGGVLTVVDNAPGSPRMIDITGNGIAADPSNAALPGESKLPAGAV